MKRDLITGIMLSSLLFLPLSANAFSTDFTSGMPEGMETTDYSKTEIVSSAFSKYTKAENGWYLEAAPDEITLSKDGIPAMLSISYRQEDEPTDNWIITPAQKISEGTLLTWTAKSIHHGLPESYDVLISETGATDPESFRLLTSVKDEGNTFIRHAIALGTMPELLGKEVRVAFAHHTHQGFMLAISRIAIEEPTKGDVWCSGVSCHYFGADDTDPELTFTLNNHGADAEIKEITLITPEGEYRGEDVKIGKLGEATATISLSNLEVGDAYFYELKGSVNGTEITLFKDFVNRSYFKRKMLVEKYTGTWCNACPKVCFQVERAISLLGNEMIYVEPHYGVSLGDILGADDYCNNMPNAVCADYPALWFNRFKEHPNYTPANLEAYNKSVLTPCKANVKITEAQMDDERITVRASYTFAEDIDNSSGLIRPGFTLIENHVPFTKGGQQVSNANNGLYFGAYHFMSSPIDKHFMINDGVVRGSVNGGCGEPDLFPSTIEAGVEYEVVHSMPRPANIYDPQNCEIVATAVDGTTKTIEVLNADKTSFSESSGITDFMNPDSNEIAGHISISTAGDLLAINWTAPQEYTINLCSIDGMLIASQTGNGNSVEFDTAGLRGIMLVNIIINDKAKTFKLMI